MSVLPEQEFSCPYCASMNTVVIDFTAGSYQEFYTDCEICCRPIRIRCGVDQQSITMFEALME